MTLIFATRSFALARRQTAYIIDLLQAAWPDLECREHVIATSGDRFLDRPMPTAGVKGLFTSELEKALLCGDVDVAVHALKDLPVENTSGIILAAVPVRDSALDVLIAPLGETLSKLPEGARVGTGSLRRKAQLLVHRRDLNILPLSGNVTTRLRKVVNGEYDAIVLAAAGLHRLGLEQHITEVLPPDLMLPAPGQGALAVQCRADDTETLHLLSAVHDASTYAAVSAERVFLSELGGGCSLPIGAFAQKNNGTIILTGAVISVDGKQSVRLSAAGDEPQELGARLAQLVLERGAGAMLV